MLLNLPYFPPIRVLLSKFVAIATSLLTTLRNPVYIGHWIVLIRLEKSFIFIYESVCGRHVCVVFDLHNVSTNKVHIWVIAAVIRVGGVARHCKLYDGLLSTEFWSISLCSNNSPGIYYTNWKIEFWSIFTWCNKSYGNWNSLGN